MDIDFTKQIASWKEKDVLHKPFPTGNGYALFSKNEEGNFIKILFSSQEHIKNYLNDLGYDWGNEGKDEYRNFDCEHRLLKVMPELSGAESVAADPQWDPDKSPEETVTKHDSSRKMEDMPHLAVELREVDHPIGYDDRTHASDDKTATSKKKLPPWMNKDKKDDKKDDKKGDKKEKGKDGKKLPPWLKKKSKSDYSELYKKVSKSNWGKDKFSMGDHVENINPKCKHFGSQGQIVGVRALHAPRQSSADHKPNHKEEDELGFVFAYAAINAGANWNKGDVLEKTPDQLKQISAPCGPAGCFY